MSIKNLYNELENNKKNKIKDSNVVTMDLQEYLDEHKDLVKILREGSREELLAEAEEQEEEMEECMKEHGIEDVSEEED